MKLTVIGCSGSLPGPLSPASCYLVEAGATTLVLDLGGGAVGPLQRHVALDDIDAVLLSHLHPDHFIDLCGLHVHRQHRPGPKLEHRLPVHGPSGTGARLAAARGLDLARITAVFECIPWNSGTQLQIDDVRVTVARVAHPGDSYAMRIEHGGRSLVYSGDTGPCDALGELAVGADLLVCEASFGSGSAGSSSSHVHLTGREAGAIATAAGVQRLLLTHLPPWGDPVATLAGAHLTFSGRLDVAMPGMVIDV